ncbi:uncharacterized protein LOC127786887 isoform X8 [Diospyros lotus]|uniref:uncharacterized protein LOC127786887 isoform X8 n=1 Tax=Diospyros lotus TaxID=55363 RepID=UPI00224F5947|nr:uncharacterized protein LOC127786887 isoform X8 [Diospyros lotus]
MEIAEQRQEKDVQEMEKTELQQQQWRQEEEDETAVALQERWSWQPSAIVVNSTGGVNVLFPLSEEPHNHNGFKKHGQEALQDGDKDGNGMEEDSKAISGKNVYYDKDQGIWKCRNCCWMYQSGSPWTGHTPHPKFWHLHMLLNTKIINQEGQCFFCKFEGTESVDGFSATENNGLLFSASERSSRDDGLVAATENFDDQESQSHAINHQTKEISNDGSFSHVGFLPSGKSEISNGGSFSHLGFLPSGKSEISNDGSFSHVGFLPSAKSEISNDGSFSHVGFLPSGKSEISNGGSFSHLGLLPSEKSSEKHKTNKSCSDITVTFDDEQTVEIDRELTEFDVERVLEKQNTHDLYCPKCNSCITGRVILHKRKRSIRIPEEDKKRNKGQPLGASQLDASIAPAQNYQGHNTVDNSLDGSLIPEANGHHSGQEPEVFRCFSCFSFFIPPGSEFKLFKKLGDKSEKENIQSPRPISEVKKNWFSRLFSSHAETVLVAQGSDHMADVGKSSVEASEKVTERGLDGTDSILLLSKPASVLGESDISENVDILADLSENGQNVDASPSTKPLVEYQNTEVKISHNGSGHMADVEKSSVEASEKVTERDTAGILLQQKALGHILKPVKNATFEHNQEGLRILVHSSTDSLVVEESHMGEKLNVAIKSKPAGSGFKLFKKLWDKSEKENIQSPRPISEVKKNWFSHLFSSHAETVLVAQGSGHMADVENSSVEASKKEIKSPHQSFDGQGEPQRGGYDETEENLDHVTERGIGTDAIIVVPAAQGVQDIIPAEARGFHGMDIIKSIVYGGLVESITSLGVVLSAAGADTTTLNILALGLANLIGGLLVIGHNLWELKNDHSGSISTETAEDASDQTSKQLDRYQELLGQKGKFSLHATFAILSYLIFGLLSPVIYGFSFRESDNRDFKLIAVAASSLLCIILLATGKAYTQRPPRSYITTVIYYVVAGFMASGVSYAAGDLIKKLLEKFGWLSSDSGLTLTIPLQQQAWGAYQDH